MLTEPKTSFHQDPFYLQELILIPSWISDHMLGSVWDEIIYPFPKFNGYPIEVWEWIINFTHTL